MYVEIRHRSEQGKTLQQSVENVIQCLTSQVFQHSVRGFYEVDRIVFTLLLALNIDLQAGNITQEEFVIFIICELQA